GISIRSLFFSLAKHISEKLKKINKPPLIVWGGIQPTLNPEKCLPWADIIVIGEGEKAFVEICKDKKFKGIKNIYYHLKNRVIRNDTGYVEENLDSIPFPDFSDKNKYLINENKLVPLSEKYKTRYYLMTSKGCPFNCSYCCNSTLSKMCRGKYLRRRSVDNVISELKEAKKNCPNLLSISFVDDVFTFDKEWLKDFSPKYKKEINIPFFCFTHAKMCDEEIIKYLKFAGLSSVAMGVQSFSYRIKKIYSRFEKNEQIIKVLKLLKKYKIEFTLDIIMDNPLEEEEDLKINLNCLLKIPSPFHLSTHTLTYFPNTALTDSFIEKGIIKKEDVEDEIEKGWGRWTPSLDLSRNKLNLFYDCLYFLTKLRFRSEFLIRKIQENKYFRENPKRLAKFLRFFSVDISSLDWDSRADKFKFLIFQGLTSLVKRDFKFL
ncbi:unnamed protein product, partial [marine sediment metagenome]